MVSHSAPLWGGGGGGEELQQHLVDTSRVVLGLEGGSVVWEQGVNEGRIATEENST